MTDRGRGRGQRGGRGRGQGRGAPFSGDTTNGRICFEFQRTGACKRTTCTFAHIDGRSDDRKAAPTKATETEEQREARESYNKWKRFLTLEPTDPSVAKRFWKFALGILEGGDREYQQYLARDLDSDDKKHKGRDHIAALLNQRGCDDDSERYIKNSERFLLIITHPSFLDCLAVDTYVGSIYNFISGANGNRVVPFFQQLCKRLIAARTNSGSSTTSPERLESTLVALSLALRELLKRERRARFNEDIETLLSILDTAANIFAPKAPTACSTHVVNHVRCMRDIIKRARGLLARTMADNDAVPAPASLYPRDLVIPSDRHDNDKLDITDIVIFPTQDEIMSDVQEFLPFTDPSQPHFLTDATQRHVDTHFRLYRHDKFGELKGALAGLLQTLSLDKTTINNSRLPLGDVRAYQYTAARTSDFVFDRAFHIHMSFLPPPEMRQQALGAQKRWLEETGRLSRGSLLSFVWFQCDKVQHVFLQVKNFGAKNGEGDTVSYDANLVTITARLVTQDKATLEMLMQARARKAQGVLLEYPNIMPATFVPILENLQDMQGLGGLAFHEWIVPSTHTGLPNAKVYHDIPPPLYARHFGFKFPLQGIAKDSRDDLFISPTSLSNDHKLINQIEARTTLDRGQCQALLAALTREFAFIQGPPGTGKSYLGLQLMKVLLAVKGQADLGPIIVVCYTNHALDQFLEHLISIGITKVVRVGGQSKSPMLAEHNLRNLKKTEPNTKSEKSLARDAYIRMDNHKDSANNLIDDMRRLHRKTVWHELKAHISEEYHAIFRQFRDMDDEGFQAIGRHPFDIWYTSGARNDNDAAPENAPSALITIKNMIRKAKADVHSLTHRERLALVGHWVQEVQVAKIGELFEVVDAANDTQKDLDNIHAESSRRILQGADVIGLTTTGLAGRMSLLKHVASKVLLCEEAGEIMEPHMISALLPTIEHCIQIGDHEQLRPSVSNFGDLSMESARGKLHQLDRSQFERLSVGEAGRPSVPVAQLNVQRRMRPDISTLIRETIYDKLVDHNTTLSLPNVVGMRKNVFWLDHNHLEDGQELDIRHSKSKSNSWEVAMVHALVRHLIRQGVYKSSDIAVLTPYTGQLQRLRNCMRSDFEIVLSERDEEALERDGFEADNKAPKRDQTAKPTVDDRVTAALEHGGKPLEKKALNDLLRVATVDNYQGEEAKVVIVSLVRSNKKRNVGFLRTKNRINVLLSRAKHGLYLVGDTDTYSNVDMWEQVIGMLRSTDAVGPSFALRCDRHPEKILEVKEPEDFARFSPEGGCWAACTDRLNCGHNCGAKCHSVAMHAAFLCEEPCQRRHEVCGHPCKREICGLSCGKCMVLVDNVRLPCSHLRNGIQCYLTQDLDKIPCDVQVIKKVPGCNHDIVVRCSQDVTRPGFCCTTPCNAPLSCGRHLCAGTCGFCTGNNKILDGKPVVRHMACIAKCDKKMGTCSHHFCGRKCHSGTDCGLCQKPCNVRCKHSSCPRRCHEACAPCIRECEWQCEHEGACNMPCSAPCDRLPCDRRCNRLLDCQHRCPSVCGETCPPVDLCQQCGKEGDANPDMLEFKPYSEIDLDESPIIRLECKHFFTLETLDGLVDLKAVYEQDPMTGRYTATHENAELTVNTPQCPTCRTPIRQYATQRYNRLINKAVIDEMTKRFIVSGQNDLQELESKFEQLSCDMEKSRQAIIPNITIPSGNSHASALVLNGIGNFVGQALANRYNAANQQATQVEAFRKKIAKNNQPANKLHQATLFAKAKASTLDKDFARLSMQSSATVAPQSADERIEQGGRLLQLKVQCLMLEDKLEISRLLKAKFTLDLLAPNAPGENMVLHASAFLNSCIEMIGTCNNSNLPKLAVEATLYHSRIAHAIGPTGTVKDEDRKTVEGHRQTARELLGRAATLCELPFKGVKALSEAVEQSLRLLGKEFYAEVTKEEIDAIKKAMVSGPGGIATHSGHWYKCVNGHPFAIGECGMPMEQARCPECGKPVGGRNHTAVQGVTRAQDMEN